MRVYLGIDWSQTSHAACFLNEAGATIARLTVPHTLEGFAQLDAARQALGIDPAACWVGLETAHTLVIDFLWARGYSQVYVIPPSAVKSTRKRYGQTNAHTDQSDVFVIGDMVRTDQARLQPWHPDSALTQQLRAKVSLWLHLTQELIRTSNRLRAVLLRYYPAPLQVFSTPFPQIGLHFIQAFPTPQAAACLSRAAFVAFARAHQYRQSDKRLLACFAPGTRHWRELKQVNMRRSTGIAHSGMVMVLNLYHSGGCYACRVPSYCARVCSAIRRHPPRSLDAGGAAALARRRGAARPGARRPATPSCF